MTEGAGELLKTSSMELGLGIALDLVYLVGSVGNASTTCLDASPPGDTGIPSWSEPSISQYVSPKTSEVTSVWWSRSSR